MAKEKPSEKKKWGKNEIPPWGRKERHVRSDIDRDFGSLDVQRPVKMGGPETFAADVPLNNTGPTEVRGMLYGNMPNSPRMARGRLMAQRGKYGRPKVF